jgi:hypothetical protein
MAHHDEFASLPATAGKTHNGIDDAIAQDEIKALAGDVARSLVNER